MKIKKLNHLLKIENWKLKITLLALVIFVFLPKAAEAGFILNRPLYIGLGSGLVGYWSFDGKDMNATQALDASGNANHGTLTNGPTRAIGKIGQALSFDGIGSYVNVGSVSASTQSVTFWMKNATSTTNKIIDLNGTATITSSSGTLSANNFTTPTIYVDGVVSSIVNDTAWHHVTITTGTAINASAVDLGRVGTNTSYGGALDDVRLYNRALTGDEIKRLYKIGATTKIGVSLNTGSIKDGLVGYWSFDGKDMNATQALDASGNANNGTLTNGPTRAIGKIGQALSFDGSDDYVEATLPPDITNTSPYTMSMWMKEIAGAGALKGFFAAFYGTDQIAVAYFDGTRNGILVNRSVLGVQASSHPASAVTITNWNHLVITGDGSNARPTLYVNGVQNDVNDGASLSGWGNSVVHLGRGVNTSFYAKVAMDDVRIYNRALSADEIKRLYRIGATLKVNTSINNDSLKNGLVGYWSFDGKDMNATQALDASGNANHGTLTNGPTRAIGKLGQALSFDGTDDYVNAGSGTSLDNIVAQGGGGMTLSAWVNPVSVGEGGTGSLFHKRGSGSAGFELRLGGTNHILFVGDTNSTSLVRTSSDNSLKLNQWQQIIFTKDNSLTAANSHIYVNGVEVSYQTTQDGAGTRDDDSPNTLFIGNDDIQTQTINGVLDDVRVYNRALTPAEIQRLYNLGR